MFISNFEVEKTSESALIFSFKFFCSARPSQHCPVSTTTDDVRLSCNSLCSRQIAATTTFSLRDSKAHEHSSCNPDTLSGRPPAKSGGDKHQVSRIRKQRSRPNFKAEAVLKMCFLNHITWQKCGHFTTITEPCSEARRRSPPTPCTSVHAPKATTLPVQSGACPDQTKHPRRQDQSGTSRPHLPTYGDGNAVFCNGQAQR